MNLILQAIKSLFRKLENNIAKNGESITKLSTRLSSVQKFATKALSTANSAKATANGKMSSQDPVGTGSFSMNRKADSSVGTYSHVEGCDNVASGSYSHAEGENTKASNSGSHAEGHSTEASGFASHAEGYSTTASGMYSHAEGENTKASGMYSHAEGHQTTASGYASHAEGYNTTAKNDYAHAEGYYTNAGSKYQHVQGKHNVVDSATKYAHIVGNGTNTYKRSNAHTLDWNGLGWFAGGLKVGGTGQDDEAAVEVALKTDIPSTIVQTVNGIAPDENGNVEVEGSGGNADLTDEEYATLVALLEEE